MFTYTTDLQLYIFLVAFFYMFSQGVFLFIVSGNCSMVPWELLSNSELKVVLWPIRIHKIIQCKCHSMAWLTIFMIFLKSYQEGDANVLHNHFLPCFFDLITYNHMQGQKKLHNPKQMRFIVLTAVTRTTALCQNVTPCSSIHCYRCFIGTPAFIFFFPELGGSHIPPESHDLSTKQHHITFLKTALSTKHMFILTKKLVLANLTLSRITWTLV